MATVSVPLPQEILPRPTQNWVVSRGWDAAFIIVAPLIALAWGGWTFSHVGANAVLITFAVFTLAHHLPTFIRIYGDLDLLRRFRWSLLLGPVVPFSLSMLLMVVAIANGHGLENLLFLTIILTVWDPWHFLMQHYGFMRIYDRSNLAPRKLASRMDLLVSGVWYGYILLAAVNWLPDLFYRFECDHGIPILRVFGSGVFPWVGRLTLAAAILMTAIYVGYVGWCSWRGYFVSWAKLVLLATTFGVMYVTYVPNDLMDHWMPGWDFAVGYATINMVHVTQYLAIVWKYNRNLAARPSRSRSGVFQRAFTRGGVAVLGTYVGLCLLYGFVLSREGQQAVGTVIHGIFELAGLHRAMPWYLGVVISFGFTSNLLHYYYDGFIWKVRHRENRENLAMERDAGGRAHQSPSWWDNQPPAASASRTLFRHGLYFGVPIAFLAISFALVREKSTQAPLKELRAAVENPTPQREGRVEDAARRALAAAEKQLEIERQMLEIRPRAKHYTYLAHLTYWRSRARTELSAMDPGATTDNQRTHRRELQDAIAALEKALDCPGPYGHREDQALSPASIDRTLSKWRLEAERG